MRIPAAVEGRSRAKPRASARRFIVAPLAVLDIRAVQPLPRAACVACANPRLVDGRGGIQQLLNNLLFRVVVDNREAHSHHLHAIVAHVGAHFLCTAPAVVTAVKRVGDAVAGNAAPRVVPLCIDGVVVHAIFQPDPAAIRHFLVVLCGVNARPDLALRIGIGFIRAKPEVRIAIHVLDEGSRVIRGCQHIHAIFRHHIGGHPARLAVDIRNRR